MKRAKQTVLLLTAVCCGILCSCDQHAVSKHAVDLSAPLQACTLRVSWWGGDDRHEAMLDAIALWNETYPEINIEPEYGGWEGWTEKVNMQFSGNTAPDVLQINYDWLIHLSADGSAFYDLQMLDEIVDFTTYTDTLLSYGTVNDTLNAVPISISGRNLFYNSTTFEALGAAYPTTWEELLSLGTVFREADCYPLDLDIDTGFTAWYLSVVYMQQQLGKEFLTMDGTLGFTEAELEDTLAFYLSLEDAGVVRSMKDRANALGAASLYQDAAFLDGTVAGVMEWGSSVSKYESVLPAEALTLGPLLTSEDAKCSGWMSKPSLLYAINAETAYPKEAATFLNFLVNDPDCAVLLGTTRGIPCSTAAYAALENAGLLNGLSYAATEQIQGCDPYSISPYFENEEMRRYYNQAIEQVSYGVVSTTEAAASLYDNLQRTLTSLKG